MTSSNTPSQPSTSSAPLRIVLVEDEALMRNGLKLMLHGYNGIEVVGEASNGKEGIEVIQRVHPDVVLMDIRMPVMTGIEAVRAVAQLQGGAGQMVPVIMLTAFDTDEFILDSLKAGARSFLLKTTAPDALHNAICAASTGQQLLSPDVVASLVKLASGSNTASTRKTATTAAGEGSTASSGEHPDPALRTAIASLSEQEREIAELIAQGLSNGDIATRLFISLPTVKTHVARVLDKLGVDNRVQIAITMLEAR